jgi:hypothetical protein
VVQSSAVVGAADSSPLGGGFIIKLNPPCTLQNCRGTLLLLVRFKSSAKDLSPRTFGIGSDKSRHMLLETHGAALFSVG